MLREFKPQAPKQKDLSFGEIESLFKKGRFKEAYRSCKHSGYRLDDFGDALQKMGRRMLYSNPGELASLVYRYTIDVGLDMPSILRSQLSKGDYHGFLKNVHRFELLNSFESEVEHAINSLKRVEEAQSWRVKFKALAGL